MRTTVEHGLSMQQFTHTRFVDLSGRVQLSGMLYLNGLVDDFKAWYRVILTRRAVRSYLFHEEFGAPFSVVNHGIILLWVGQAWKSPTAATMQRSCRPHGAASLVQGAAGGVYDGVEMCRPDGPLLCDECSTRLAVHNVINAYVCHADALGISPAEVPAEVGASNEEVISRLNHPSSSRPDLPSHGFDPPSYRPDLPFHTLDPPSRRPDLPSLGSDLPFCRPDLPSHNLTPLSHGCNSLPSPCSPLHLPSRLAVVELHAAADVGHAIMDQCVIADRPPPADNYRPIANGRAAANNVHAIAVRHAAAGNERTATDNERAAVVGQRAATNDDRAAVDGRHATSDDERATADGRCAAADDGCSAADDRHAAAHA
ncbi:unnamed protein product [Closterium sp. NIES-54]